MISTIASQVQLKQAMQLFSGMQDTGRRVTEDDIETMGIAIKRPTIRPAIDGLVTKRERTPLAKAATNPGIIKSAGILIHGRYLPNDLSKTNTSVAELQNAFTEADRRLQL